VLYPDIIIRINGTLPDVTTLGDELQSERSAEVKQTGMAIKNTSCSLFAKNKTNNEIFHVLIDVGEGIVKSLEKTIPELGLNSSSSSFLPNALLITHAHDDHIKELPLLINNIHASTKRNIKIYCTKECHDQIINKFNQLSEMNNQVSFNIVHPEEILDVGPFSVMPVRAYHGNDDLASGSVVYIIKVQERKIIIGWDFVSLPDVDQNLFWNPDLVILGTQTYNHHPETGLISVSEAYEIMRTWNAKECYILHYGGLSDFEEAKNQWFRGPVKAMTISELQQTIDRNLRLTGNDGKYKMTVAKEGMILTVKGKDLQQQLYEEKQNRIYHNSQTSSLGEVLEIEGLQEYILRIEKEKKNDKLNLMIEDRVNRFNLRFIKPRKNKDNNGILYAQGEKGMMSRGPELVMEIVEGPPSEGKEFSSINIRVFKGKKNIFRNQVPISKADAQRLRQYIREFDS
jgi:phosphoribosyl 1,2-cyclic phosphodiesterase